ncbi:cytochrome P450 [Streptomyces sp. P38-E01]|uniref:Cytochrome P450 n=2 Tax=Streptomyces tardus TaxID=2780544 RepID=A0A949NAM9_9ACTN|nr:cytochrome P450 [Streptomyces tardus]
MTLIPAAPADPAAALAAREFWQLPWRQRELTFAALREREGPTFVRDGSAGGGFWAVVRHAEVTEASRNREVFRSAPGATAPPPPRWVRWAFGDSMVNLDDPEHAALRRVVARSFTPRLLARVEEDVRSTASALVDAVQRERPADFVSSLAGPMPFTVICSMMGVPVELRPRILALVEVAARSAGQRQGVRRWARVPGQGLRALASLQRIMVVLGRERQRRPADDLITSLVTADVRGEALTGRQLGAYFSLLLVAGVETTRNALAHGLCLLTAHPEQRARLWADPEGMLDGAVEEIIRCSVPITQFRRTVARPYTLGGVQLGTGDRVALFYCSANHDERIFDRPERFDIGRSPNPHLGFGGGGAHYCLGAHLARQEMRALLGELVRRLPGVRSTAEPRLGSAFFDHRVVGLPFTF